MSRIVTLSYAACAVIGLTIASALMVLLDFNRDANMGVIAACALVAIGMLADAGRR